MLVTASARRVPPEICEWVAGIGANAKSQAKAKTVARKVVIVPRHAGAPSDVIRRHLRETVRAQHASVDRARQGGAGGGIVVAGAPAGAGDA